MNRPAARQIPPFSSQAARLGKYDPSSPGGAAILAERIAKIWAAHGGEVTTRVELLNVGSTMRSAVYCVRSDLLNAIPRARR